MTPDDLNALDELIGMTFRTRAGKVAFTVDTVDEFYTWLEMPTGHDWRVTGAHLLLMARSGQYDIREF